MDEGDWRMQDGQIQTEINYKLREHLLFFKWDGIFKLLKYNPIFRKYLHVDRGEFVSCKVSELKGLFAELGDVYVDVFASYSKEITEEQARSYDWYPSIWNNGAVKPLPKKRGRKKDSQYDDAVKPLRKKEEKTSYSKKKDESLAQYKLSLSQDKIPQDEALEAINQILEPHNLKMDIHGLERMVNDIGYLESSIAGNVGDITYFKGLEFQNFLTRLGRALPGTCRQKKYATEITSK